jgi:hypothetical protein
MKSEPHKQIEGSSNLLELQGTAIQRIRAFIQNVLLGMSHVRNKIIKKKKKKEAKEINECSKHPLRWSATLEDHFITLKGVVGLLVWLTTPSFFTHHHHLLFRHSHLCLELTTLDH